MRTLRALLIAATVALAACNDTDARITAGVTERLAREPNPDLIEVTTRDRIVTLRGFVDSPAEQQRLESAAREVQGVIGVDSRLAMKPPVVTTGAAVERGTRDRDVQAAVQHRFVQMNLSGIDVMVRHGIVTLRGEIPSADRANAVLAAAEASPDVVRVDDRLLSP